MTPTQPEGNASIQLPSVKTQKQVIIARKYLAALSLCQFVQGWNDGSTGPLLPRIQRVYHASCAIPLTSECSNMFFRWDLQWYP